MEIIPAIDLQDGRCVRLFQGDFSRQTEYSNDPVAVAQKFEVFGFGSLHVVDLDGALSGRQANQEIVRRVVGKTGFSVQLGGGIRDDSDIRTWLAAGVSRCVLGSVAVTRRGDVHEWLGVFGPDRIVLALDVRTSPGSDPMLATHGWLENSDTTLWEAVDDYCRSGLKHVLCTDISRDGAMAGPNLDLYREFGARYPDVSLQASGGVRDIDDLAALRDCGSAAAITGRALLDGQITPEEVASFLRDE